MFIESGASDDALRQEGDVKGEDQILKLNMAAIVSLVVYKHLPPDGGKMSKLQTPPASKPGVSLHQHTETASQKVCGPGLNESVRGRPLANAPG